MDIHKLIPVAEAFAALSKDPSTKVGAIAVDPDGLVLASGFNGFPRGVSDAPERYADRAFKLPRIVHAEQNLIAMAARHGIRLMGSTLILTALYPCCDCAKSIIQAGITRVLAPPMPTLSNWSESVQVTKELFAEAGVVIEEYSR